MLNPEEAFACDGRFLSPSPMSEAERARRIRALRALGAVVWDRGPTGVVLGADGRYRARRDDDPPPEPYVHEVPDA